MVLDASVVTAALIDNGPAGQWAEEMLVSGPIAAPQMMPAEVANVLRRAALAGRVSADAASLAHADLQALRVDLFPYWPFADRVWALRTNVTSYDAWYVALAEYLSCPLVTFDARLAGAAGPTCAFRTPSAVALD